MWYTVKGVGGVRVGDEGLEFRGFDCDAPIPPIQSQQNLNNNETTLSWTLLKRHYLAQ